MSVQTVQIPTSTPARKHIRYQAFHLRDIQPVQYMTVKIHLSARGLWLDTFSSVWPVYHVYFLQSQKFWLPNLLGPRSLGSWAWLSELPTPTSICPLAHWLLYFWGWERGICSAPTKEELLTTHLLNWTEMIQDEFREMERSSAQAVRPGEFLRQTKLLFLMKDAQLSINGKHPQKPSPLELLGPDPQAKVTRVRSPRNR